MATLSFWGAAGTVTGSKYLVESAGKRILVDCGIFQGLKELRERNWQAPPFDPRSLDAVVLTHAHIDHTGYLPRLAAQGYGGPIYCTRATAELCAILLPDSARLQEEEADYRNRHQHTRHHPALPLYTEADALNALQLFRPVEMEKTPFSLADGIRVQATFAGHLLGARSLLMELDGAGEDQAGRRLFFSGDIGNYDRPILNDPEPPPACDYLLVESTYGNRLHNDPDPNPPFIRILRDAAQRQRKVLIPAFSVGRTQDLLYIIRELEDEGSIPRLPIWVDSPMSREATKVYARMCEEHDEEFQARPAALYPHLLRTTATKEDSKKLNEVRGAHVILSAAGMMTGGRVLHHAMRVLPDPEAVLLFVGYQSEGTTGRRILDGEPEVKLFKQRFPVRCRIENIEGFSGHADWKGILRWLEGMPFAPRQTFITHGEPDAAKAMRGHIEERFGWKVRVPQYADRVELL